MIKKNSKEILENKKKVLNETKELQSQNIVMIISS